MEHSSASRENDAGEEIHITPRGELEDETSTTSARASLGSGACCCWLVSGMGVYNTWYKNGTPPEAPESDASCVNMLFFFFRQLQSSHTHRAREGARSDNPLHWEARAPVSLCRSGMFEFGMEVARDLELTRFSAATDRSWPSVARRDSFSPSMEMDHSRRESRYRPWF